MTAAAAWLGAAVRQLRDFTEAAKQRAREEIGEESDDIEWKALDPRQYDPRRIIAEAMLAPATVPHRVDLPAPSHGERTIARRRPASLLTTPREGDKCEPGPWKETRR